MSSMDNLNEALKGSRINYTFNGGDTASSVKKVIVPLDERVHLKVMSPRDIYRSNESFPYEVLLEDKAGYASWSDKFAPTGFHIYCRDVDHVISQLLYITSLFDE